MGLDARQLEFIRLLSINERRLYGYILTLVPNWHDADEILQETNIRLWEEFEKFQPGTSFAAWAMRVAHFQVLTWRKRAKRSRLVFDDDIVEMLCAEQEAYEGLAARRQEALAGCIQKVDERSRQLLWHVYSKGDRIKDVAVKMGKSVDAAHKIMQRTRLFLRHCVEHQLAEDGLT